MNTYKFPGKFQRMIMTPLDYKTYRYSVVNVLIVVNVIIFVITAVDRSGYVLGVLSMRPILFLKYKFYWNVVTYMFVHGGISHVFFNMLGLFFFGSAVERTWGSKEFIVLYAVIGTVAGIFSLIVYTMTGAMNTALVGASGAIYGIMLIFSCLYPHQKIYVFGVFPISAKMLMLILIGISFLSAISGSSMGGRNIANITHLSGVGVAWIYLQVRHKINPYHRLMGK